MKTDSVWQESKYLVYNGVLRPSQDEFEVGVGSRITARLVAEFYSKALPAHAKGRLLDLGCGKAPLYGFYSKFVSEVIRADWPNSVHHNPSTDVYCDIGKPLPFSNVSFDTVLLSDVLEHLPDPSLLWQELARILAPGGKVIGNIPFLYWIHEAPFDYQRLTPYALTQYMLKVRLQPLELRRIGRPLDTWMDLTAKLAAPVPVIGRIIAKGLSHVSSLLRPYQDAKQERNPMPLSIGFVATK